MSEPIGAGRQRLHDVDPEGWLAEVGYDDAFADLDEGERERAMRFHREIDRRLFVAAHALLRRELARSLDLRPAELAFSGEPMHRPELARPGGTGLRFNLSHTRGRVALVIARGLTCGVDVEQVDRGLDPLELAPRVYSREEREWLRDARGDGELRDRFFRLWTVKEAYAKARGLGFSLSFAEYTFDLTGAAPRLASAPEGSEELGRWSFGERRPTASHRMAWCIECAP